MYYDGSTNDVHGRVNENLKTKHPLRISHHPHLLLPSTLEKWWFISSQLTRFLIKKDVQYNSYDYKINTF